MAVAVVLSGLRRIIAFVVETPQLKVDLLLVLEASSLPLLDGPADGLNPSALAHVLRERQHETGRRCSRRPKRRRPGRADCPASTERWFYDARLQEADN